MKREDLVDLLYREEGSLRLNPLCKLNRWTSSNWGYYDYLEIDFEIPNYIRVQMELKERDIDSLIKEIKKVQKKILKLVKKNLDLAMKGIN